jgi:hypothetical protein
MMNIYKPYIVELASDSELHLKETSARKSFLFIYFRVFPILLILLYGGFAASGADIDETLQTLLFGSVLLLVILFLCKTYVTEVKISRHVVELTGNFFFVTSKKTWLVSDLEKILVRVEKGRGGGFFYKLKTSERKILSLFTIPLWYMDMENLLLINDQLTIITGLPVEQV